MSKAVPEGWSYGRLGDYISESVAGEWGVEAAGDENDIPVLRSTNFTASGVIDYSKLAYRNIDERKRLTKSLKLGDIVLEKSGGSPTQPVGRVVYFDRNEPFLYSNFTQKLSAVDECDSKFLFYKLYSEYQNGTVLKFQQQTTGIINFQLAEYLGFKSVFPPLPEQQKIATILSSVDDVIEKTRAQIDKLKDLKTGLMQELLTKGIGHTDFKDSAVGSVPVSWNVVSIGSLLTFKNGLNKEKKYFGRGKPIVNFTDVFHGYGIKVSDLTGKVELTPSEQERFSVKKGDVFFTRTSETPNEIGMAAVFLDDIENVSFSGFVLRGRPVSHNLEISFCKYCFSADYLRTQIISSCSYTTRALTNGSLLSQCLIAVPPKTEQLEITKILDALLMRLSMTQQKLKALHRIKQALMQDLLTGKVRVNIENKEPAVA